MTRSWSCLLKLKGLMFTLVIKLCLLYSYKVLRNLGFQPLSRSHLAGIYQWFGNIFKIGSGVSERWKSPLQCSEIRLLKAGNQLEWALLSGSNPNTKTCTKRWADEMRSKSHWRIGGGGVSRNFFIFMQFSGKIYQILGWRPISGVGTPLWNPGSACLSGQYTGTLWENKTK